MTKLERIEKYKKFMGDILTQEVFIEKLDELGFFTPPP